jgi:hypothetical protein
VQLLQTFFSHRVQPLCQRVTIMWLYSGPSCPDSPFFVELGKAEINTCVHKVLSHRANLNPGAGPAPLMERVDSTRVSLRGSNFLAIPIVQSSHQARIFAQGLAYPHSMPQGGFTFPKDVSRQKVNRAHNEKLRTQK